MDRAPMLESKINDIITTIYDGEHILLPANSRALEIIKKRTNPAGMMNRHYVFQSAAILHQMMVEMQVTTQALGSMDVMTHAFPNTLMIPGTVWLYHLCLSIAQVKAELILVLL